MIEIFNERNNKLLKFLDKYLGIPLVFSLGFLKKKQRNIPSSIKSIALLKTAAIGDTILLSAIIKDIKEALPATKITFFTGSSNYEIAKIICENYPDTNVVKLPIKNFLQAISIIRQYNFDVWIDFGTWPRLNALYSYFAKANFKIGFKTRNQYRHYVYDIAVEHNGDIHEIFNYKNLLKVLGIEGKNLPSINVVSDANNIKKNNKLIVLHMFPGGSKGFLKEWPKSYWIQLINYLTKKGFQVALTGAKKDRDRALEIYNLCNKKDYINVVAGNLTLKETLLLLKTSYLVISVDTGIMHLASALNRNLIALHGPTSPKRWGPLNKNSITITSSLECSPCLNLGFESKCSENKCMKSISVETVIKAVEFFYKKR